MHCRQRGCTGVDVTLGKRARRLIDSRALNIIKDNKETSNLASAAFYSPNQEKQ